MVKKNEKCMRIAELPQKNSVTQVETLEKLTGKGGQKKDGKNGHAARTLKRWFFGELRHAPIHSSHEPTNFSRKPDHEDESDAEEVNRKWLVC